MHTKVKQHTVPAFYLSNFTDKDGFNWVLNAGRGGLETDKIFKARPEKILTENYFYNISLSSGGGSSIIEDTLANIEGTFADIFRRKISKQLGLTGREQLMVAIFVASMFFRTKSEREGLRKAFEDIKKQMEGWKEFFHANPRAKEFSASISKGSNDRVSAKDLEHMLSKFDEVHSVSLIDMLPELANIIFHMKWAFLSPENENDIFITSDTPGSRLKPEALKKYGPGAFGSIPSLHSRDIELTLPLSSKIALLAGWKLQTQEYLKVPTVMIEQINIRQRMNASEKIIAAQRIILENILEDMERHH